MLYKIPSLKAAFSGPVFLRLLSSTSVCNSKTIEKVLIANRGEIACRVIRTAKRLGIKSVAVFSDADANSLHVQLADEAVHIGAAASSESYLNVDKILAVASRLHVDAIHPGYGFLSESVEFANACARSGVTFIGPPTNAIRDMGIKSISKRIMSDAGVPIIPGYHGEDQSVEKLRLEADRIGYPVMLKAVRGGGGKGMRICESPKDFEAMLESAKSEAMKAFANSDMLIEKFVVKPRHVEVQVFCDKLGNAVHLFERDCSVQRRHQKIIEEAPAPGVSRDRASQLGEVAVKAAKAVNYVGAGTVEFVMDKDLNFYFMEMNTRLQVEHPITEMITGQDLVEWQFKVAEGSPLPLSQSEIQVNGHSFEARIYAEDPDSNFMPGAGALTRLVAPEPVANEVRIETGVEQGDDVSVHYDPLIAKLVVWGQDRSLALRKLASSLDSYQILGLKTNICFLKALSSHEAFIKGDVNTDFIPDNYGSLFKSSDSNVNNESVLKACLALIYLRRLQLPKSGSPWNTLHNFRINSEESEVFKWRSPINNETVSANVKFLSSGGFSIEIDCEATNCEILTDWKQLDSVSHNNVRCKIGDHIVTFGAALAHQSTLSLFPSGSSEIIEWHVEPVQKTKMDDKASKSGSDKSAMAPMTGIIDKVLVKVGDVIRMNDPLVVMTAMKMEYTIKAPKDGMVQSVLFNSGDTVNRHTVIVDIADQ